MELPAAVIMHLRDLVAGVEADSEALVGSLTDLAADVQAVIASYRGLVLTLVVNGWPITLVAFTPDDPRPVVTSLRLPLELVDPTYEDGSSIAFYAATPGALVDLAADLSHVLGPEVRSGGRSLEHDGQLDGQRDGQETDRTRPTIDLDIDLPPPVQRSGLLGLADYSAINRAIGKLIDQGHQPAEAHQTLRRGAAAAGVEPHAWARRLLADG